MAYTIQNFWEPRLANVEGTNQELISGWSYWNDRLRGFVEAPLTLSNEFSCDTPPEHSSIILVSAPGAVGKTTLAREIARITQAIYVDLSKAKPVASDTLTGGLVNSNVFMEWKDQTTTVLIDGLDEARFRTTWEGFEAFLADLAARSQGRNLPTILFGRTGAIQDAYLVLDDIGSKFSVLEIGYYDATSAIEFIMNRVKIAKKVRDHENVERKAAESILAQLRKQTERDGDRFSGYAPVLQSIATHISGHNPSRLLIESARGVQPMTLQDVVSRILERESQKLRSLRFTDESLVQRLYLPKEPLDHLVSRLYGTPKPDLPAMNPDDAQTYDDALKTWIPEHPFLSGASASSAVFEAVIGSHALSDTRSSDIVLRRYLSRGDASNPFLCEFYPQQPDGSNTDRAYLYPEHIGIVYASYRARLAIGDAASLSIEGDEAVGVGNDLSADVEMTISREDLDEPRMERFTSDHGGTIYLGKYVDDVEISAPYANIEVGDGRETVFVAPVHLTCSQLSFRSRKVIIEPSSDMQMRSVFLEAKEVESIEMGSPIVRSGAEFLVSWEGNKEYPWTSYAVGRSVELSSDPNVTEALRRLRRFVIAFRSHKKGALARYRAKIEHERMTKGVGRRVLDGMIEEGIVYIKGSMYFLDPNRLHWQTGVTYDDCVKYKFDEKALKFVLRSLKNVD